MADTLLSISGSALIDMAEQVIEVIGKRWLC